MAAAMHASWICWIRHQVRPEPTKSQARAAARHLGELTTGPLKSPPRLVQGSSALLSQPDHQIQLSIQKFGRLAIDMRLPIKWFEVRRGDPPWAHVSLSGQVSEVVEGAFPQRHFTGSAGSFALLFAASRTITPDADVITQLSRRGTVRRTDVDDDVCANNPEKIGEGAEGKPGDAAMRLFIASARTPTLPKSQARER